MPRKKKFLKPATTYMHSQSAQVKSLQLKQRANYLSYIKIYNYTMTQCVVFLQRAAAFTVPQDKSQYQCLHSCSVVQQPHEYCIRNPCPLWFFQLCHTPERMEGVIDLHFRCYPKQGGINGRHRHIPGDLRPGAQQRFQPWPRESPFAMWQQG